MLGARRQRGSDVCCRCPASASAAAAAAASHSLKSQDGQRRSRPANWPANSRRPKREICCSKLSFTIKLIILYALPLPRQNTE